MLPTPVTKDELLENARVYVMDYVKVIIHGCVQKRIPIDSLSASLMARIALQCYCEGALAIVEQLETKGRSIKQVLELTADEIDAYVRAHGGMSPEEGLKISNQHKAELAKS